METEPDFEHPMSDNPSPVDPSPNSFKKINSPDINNQQSDELENQYESDGLDPLFSEPTAKRALDFSFDSEEDAHFETQKIENDDKKRESSVDLRGFKEKKRRTKRDVGKTHKNKSNLSEKKERKARLAQHADFQRVMRERKEVGFKPAPMVEKSISSVLEKIRQRKMQVFKKVMPLKEIELDGDSEEDDHITDILDGGVQIAVETDRHVTPKTMEIENESCSNDDRITSNIPTPQETTQSFRAPINDTQDLYVDSEKSYLDVDDSNEASPAEDITPSAPSLNLQLDSAFADDISSSDEESDKENVDPRPKHLYRENPTAIGDPVKEFLDEEALDDDSDNDCFLEKDEEDISDQEENCDYIATDVVEKRIDLERNNLYHQQWLQQQDEVGTEKILQKLNGMKRQASYLDDEDAYGAEDEGDESERDVAFHKDEGDESDNEFAYGEDEKGYIASGVTTKKLRQMIPLMFTDKDDVYVSSEDEETEKNLSKQYMLQRKGQEHKSNFISPAKEKASTEVFGRIKKLNVIPETKKTKITSFFDPLRTKGSSSNSSKSFLRRASSHPGPSNHRHGSTTVKSYIFGRDDSNSRSSMSLPDDSPNLRQKESHAKKNGTAKFVSSQANSSTQITQMETANSGKSLFDILRCSSVQRCYETSDNMVVDDQLQAVFAAFKTVKKHTTKIEGRSY